MGCVIQLSEKKKLKCGGQAISIASATIFQKLFLAYAPRSFIFSPEAEYSHTVGEKNVLHSHLAYRGSEAENCGVCGFLVSTRILKVHGGDCMAVMDRSGIIPFFDGVICYILMKAGKLTSPHFHLVLQWPRPVFDPSRLNSSELSRTRVVRGGICSFSTESDSVNR